MRDRELELDKVCVKERERKREREREREREAIRNLYNEALLPFFPITSSLPFHQRQDSVSLGNKTE